MPTIHTASQTWQTIPRPQEGASVVFDLTVQMNRSINGENKSISMTEGGFAICIQGIIYAYRNHCPHVGSPLDWLPNQFFNDDTTELICHTHGARFNPVTGDCIAGPCPRGLYPLPIEDCQTHILVPTQFCIAT